MVWMKKCTWCSGTSKRDGAKGKEKKTEKSENPQKWLKHEMRMVDRRLCMCVCVCVLPNLSTFTHCEKCTCYCKRPQRGFWKYQTFVLVAAQLSVIRMQMVNTHTHICMCWMELIVTLTSWDIRHPCIWLAPHAKYSLVSSVDSLAVSGADKYAPIVSSKCC